MTTLERLKVIFKNVKPNIDVENITVDTRLLEDLGVDSLSLMLLAMYIEDEFKFQFDTITNRFKTVGDLVNYIDQKIQ